MSAARALVVASALTLVGCGLFAALTTDTQSQAQVDADAEARRQAEEAAQQQAQADQQLAAELNTLRVAAQVETATVVDVVAYVDKYIAAANAGAVDRGRVLASHADDAWTLLDVQWAKVADVNTPEAARDRATIEVARGALRFNQGRTDEAAGHFLAAIEIEPTYELFSLLISVPKTPVSDAAVLQACPQVRAAVAAELVTDFVAVCLDAAGGDRKALKWKTAKADLKTHDAEMERRAEEERLRLEEAAVQAAQAQTYALAAVFAAGRCRFQNCLKDGWEASTEQGTVTTTCRFQNCLVDGWETRFPDGSSATTTCRFQDCMKDGWETQLPDGSSATTTCRFQNCPVDGWETSLPGGMSATTTCRFQDCFKDGWEISMPDGTINCTCQFQDCLKNGTECG
jgi:hypothetical protein